MTRKSENPRVAEINEYLTRRRLLQGAGVAGATMLAGCDGSDGGSTDTTTGDDGDEEAGGDGGNASQEDGGGNGEMVELVQAAASRQDQFHMNGAWGPANHISHGSRFGRILFDPVVKFASNTLETHPVHASDWGIEGETAFVELREQTWHNGDPYTAESIALYYDIQSMINEHNEQETNMDRFVEGWEVENDLRITFDLTQQWNPNVFAKNLLDEQMYPFHPDHWNDWRSRLEDAGPGSDEFEQVLSELSEHTDVTVGGKEFVGYGPYKFDTAESDFLAISRYEDHPDAGDIEVDRMIWESHENPELAWLNEQTDMMPTGFPLGKDLQNQMPPEDQVSFFSQDNNRLLRLAFNNGEGLENQERPTFEREIRHSIGFAINRNNAAAAQGQGIWEPWQLPDTNLHFNDIESDWFDAEGFVRHSDGGEPKTDRAVEMIEASERYSYEDDTVVNQDGSQAELVLMTADFPTRVPLARSVASDLNSLGWDVVLDIVDDPTFVDRRANGEFDVYIDPSSIDDSLENWKSGAILGYDQPRFRYPTVWEIPMPVGNTVIDPDQGEMKKFDLSDPLGTMESTTDEQTQQEVLQKLAWAWNMYLPGIWVASRPWMGALHDNFEITTDDPSARASPDAMWWLPREGYITPSG